MKPVQRVLPLSVLSTSGPLSWFSILFKFAVITLVFGRSRKLFLILKLHKPTVYGAAEYCGAVVESK